MNAGDLGSILTVCACAYDLTDVTAQGQSHGSTAHVYPLHTRVKILCVRVLFPMESREFYDHIWALTRHFGHMCCMLDSDWSKKILLLSDWLGPIGASFTTDIYCQSSRCHAT